MDKCKHYNLLQSTLLAIQSKKKNIGALKTRNSFGAIKIGSDSEHCRLFTLTVGDF